MQRVGGDVNLFRYTDSRSVTLHIYTFGKDLDRIFVKGVGEEVREEEKTGRTGNFVGTKVVGFRDLLMYFLR